MCEEPHGGGVIQLDLRDKAIIDAFPYCYGGRTVLDVGAGKGDSVDRWLANQGYHVETTDLKEYSEWEDAVAGQTCYIANVLDDSFKLSLYDVVICSEVLEHIKDYRAALHNLLLLAESRVIITVPWERSYDDPDHVNYWDDKTILEFHELCKPYSVAISKIRTKPKDVEMNQYDFLIVVDKHQDMNT